MKHASAIRRWLILGMVLLLAASQGCSLLPGTEQPDPAFATLQAALIQTATAAKQQNITVGPQATAQPQVTDTHPAIQAVQTTRAAKQNETQIAEATAAAPIVAELPQYGLDKTSGHMGWVHNPLTLDITGYQQFTYGNDHMNVTAANFVLAADITWDTQYGSSGCGFMFRSNGDKKKPNQYMLIATRFASGHVIFSALSEGEIANIHDFYPKNKDNAFQWGNGTTNRLAVVARGPKIEIYTNGVKIGEVDTTKPPAQLPQPPKPLPPLDLKDIPAMNAYKNQMAEYEKIIQQSQSSYQLAVKNYMNRPAVFNDGFLAMIAATESGRTVCTYKNAWLWLIDQ